MIIKRLLTAFLAGGLSLAMSVSADSVLEYTVSQGERRGVETVNIKAGWVWIRGAGGNANQDALYEQAKERLALIDHGTQRYTPVNEASLGQITSRIQRITPLLRGLGDQLQRMNPEQRAKLENVLGPVPLGALTHARQEMTGTEVKPTGQHKKIAGVNCAVFHLQAGKLAEADICLARTDALGLNGADAETLQALSVLLRRLAAASTEGLAASFGLDISSGDLDRLTGIPVEIKDRKGRRPLIWSLKRAGPAKGALQPIMIPDSYQAETLRLW